MECHTLVTASIATTNSTAATAAANLIVTAPNAAIAVAALCNDLEIIPADDDRWWFIAVAAAVWSCTLDVEDAVDGGDYDRGWWTQQESHVVVRRCLVDLDGWPSSGPGLGTDRNFLDVIIIGSPHQQRQ